VLYTFTGGADGAPGISPLLRDSKGNLYGTATYGGSSNCQGGCGTVFRLDTTGKLTVLYSFTGGSDGASPMGGLLQDAKGNLYGVTKLGGVGSGTVFKLHTTGKLTTLYRFTGGTDGGVPQTGLLRDAKGNLYGTTELGGSSNCQEGCGVVFKLDTIGKLTTLYSFAGGTDGNYPLQGLVQDQAGNFYGTTAYGGGSSNCQGGCGTVFRLDTTSKETVLYSFTGGTDGASPWYGHLLRDPAGNLYGDTLSGGGGSCNGGPFNGCGVVFKVDTTGKETVLYSFTGGRDGGNPYSGVVLDKTGNLYGTAFFGGDTSCHIFSYPGCGVVFNLDTTGKETVLHRFTGGRDGAYPFSTVLRDKNGNLYGSTFDGASGYGTVFKISGI